MGLCHAEVDIKPSFLYFTRFLVRDRHFESQDVRSPFGSLPVKNIVVAWSLSVLLSIGLSIGALVSTDSCAKVAVSSSYYGLILDRFVTVDSNWVSGLVKL